MLWCRESGNRIAFYIFSYESRFPEFEQDERKLEKLKEQYEILRLGLEEWQDAGRITEYTKCTVIDMSNKVLDNIAQKYEKVREGVKGVMGGRILDYEAKDILNQGKIEGKREGKIEGKREGRLEGRLEMLLSLVQDGILTIAEAARRADMTEAVFADRMSKYQP